MLHAHASRVSRLTIRFTRFTHISALAPGTLLGWYSVGRLQLLLVLLDGWMLANSRAKECNAVETASARN